MAIEGRDEVPKVIQDYLDVSTTVHDTMDEHRSLSSAAAFRVAAYYQREAQRYMYVAIGHANREIDAPHQWAAEMLDKEAYRQGLDAPTQIADKQLKAEGEIG